MSTAIESQINVIDAITNSDELSYGNGNTALDRITDTTLANNLAQYLVGNALYWREADKWLLWDGKHWSVDAPGGLFPLLDKHINDLIVKVAKSEKMPSDARFRNFREFCRYEQHSRKEQLIRALSVIPALIIESHRLDAHPMLLNCLNGTFNLATAKLQEHDPADLITMLCPLEYDQNAQCPIFKSFLDRIFTGNAELIGYIKRLAG